jgi:hypothetical protein
MATATNTLMIYLSIPSQNFLSIVMMANTSGSAQSGYGQIKKAWTCSREQYSMHIIVISFFLVSAWVRNKLAATRAMKSCNILTDAIGSVVFF